MSESTALTTFFTNTAKALKHSTVDDLNEALTDFLKTKGKDTTRIECVLDLVSAKYSITKRTLKTSNARGKVQIARNMAYCLLHFDVCLDTRYVARIFDKWPNCVSRGISYFKLLDGRLQKNGEFLELYMDDKYKKDREFMDNYRMLQKKINAK